MARPLRNTLVMLSCAFGLYLLAGIFVPGLTFQIVTVACDILAFSVIFSALQKSGNKSFRLSFLMTGGAVLCWTLGDFSSLLAAHVLHQTPVGGADLMYLVAHLLLIGATIYYLTFRLYKWDTVQMIVDALVFSFAFLWLFWVLVLDKTFQFTGTVPRFDINASTSIVINVFQFLLIGLWLLSIRKIKVPVFFRILVASMLCLSFANLLYYFGYARNLRIPFPFLNVLFMVALFGLAFSIQLYYTAYPVLYDNRNQNAGVTHRSKSLLLFFFPFTILVFAGIDVYDIVFYALLLIFHELASSYIQKTLQNKALLEKEMRYNKELELLVAEQTTSLKATNTALRQRNKELRFINLHDPLTSLHNRTYFLERLERFIKTASPKAKVALILWNVDNLKGINDTYGHFTGDKILIMHAQRAKEALRGVGVLARLGGDEFALALTGDIPEAEALRVAQLVTGSCKPPFQVGDYTFNISVKIGIALCPDCAGDRSMLLRNADIAMHYAKETKPEGHIATYSAIDMAMDRKYLIGNYLKTADYDQDLKLYFQPQFRISDRGLIGMEALLRWNCPGIGPVSPAEFVPIAEEENLIIPIGSWVIENAVRQITAWNNAYHTNLQMGINISPKQFNQLTTFEVLDAAIHRHRTALQWIDIEITEGVALDSHGDAGNLKKYFKTRGISVSIDDFGTGYTSLGYLTILSFDRLKIAKPLIDGITTDESRRKIVTSIILLAKSLELRTIAEGVETKEQFSLLLELGCDQIQGYYLGKPVSAEEFEEKYLKTEAE